MAIKLQRFSFVFHSQNNAHMTKLLKVQKDSLKLAYNGNEATYKVRVFYEIGLKTVETSMLITVNNV